jgi:hypothetical protein
MFFLKVVFYLIVILVITYFAVAYYVDVQLAKKYFPDAYNDCRKVWTARGIYGEGVDENSIQSIGHAFSEGAMGVEVDIFYDVEMRDYIVSHNFPYQLKNGKILPLSELFDAVGDGHYFWLDFKKLRRLTNQQANEAVQRLKEISAKNGLSERIYVEGENPTNLAHFRKAGFHTIFDTHPEPDNSFFEPFMITVYKMFYYFGDHTVMGMEYGDIDNPVFGPNTRRRLGDIPVFLYHVPVDEALLDELLSIKSVRAFIVGNNQSVNFHYKNACQ